MIRDGAFRSSDRRNPLPGRFWISMTLLGTLAAVTSGCIQPKSIALELPEEPIAFLHWPKDVAKKRFDLFEKAVERLPMPPSHPAPERHQENEIRALLRAEKTSGLHEKLAKNPGRLMLLWPRTGEVTRLEAAPLGSHPLAWSSDHKRLLFASAHRGGREQLYEYHLERQDLRPVTIGPVEHPRGDYDDDDQLVVLRLKRDSNLAAARQTVHLAGAGGRLGPTIAEAIPPGTVRIAPTGGRLVYEQIISRPRAGGATVYESMIATRSLEEEGPEQRLLRGREPTWTPDGQWIVFASPSSAGYRLRRMRPDGTARVPISPGGSEERMPSVSPDGQFVVFVQLMNGYRRLTVRRFDGKSEMRLLKDGWSEFPVW